MAFTANCSDALIIWVESISRNFSASDAPAKFSVFTGEAAGFTLDEEIYVKPGEVMVKKAEQGVFGEPCGFVLSGGRIRANLIWLGVRRLVMNKTYLLKLGCAKADVRLERIERFFGVEAETPNGAEMRHELLRHECGGVILRLSRPIALSSFYDNACLGRFVIVDGFDAAGCGIVLENLSAQTAREVPAGLEGLGGGFEEELFSLLKKYFPHRFG